MGMTGATPRAVVELQGDPEAEWHIGVPSSGAEEGCKCQTTAGSPYGRTWRNDGAPLVLQVVVNLSNRGLAWIRSAP